jgi:hypothetical protein
MTRGLNRRAFVKASAATASIIGLGGELAALAPLSPLAAAETMLSPEDVRLTPEIEPLVRLIEDTPRERAVPMMIEQLRKGVSYRQFLAALFLASARLNVSPHHFYMIYSAHQLSLEVPAEDRLLPLFWALDTLQHGRGPGTRFPKIKTGPERSPAKAAAELEVAMQQFDFERAEGALLTLVRSEGGKAALGRLWHYVARDPTSIGHRAIAFVSAWRTLETIGWQHAEPVCQFVIRELNGGRYLPPRYHSHVERGKRSHELPAGWAGDRGDRGATLELVAHLHEGDGARSCDWTYDSLRKGSIEAQSVWDAVFLSAAEVMLRFNTYDQLPARPLHTTTAINALRYAFDTSPDPGTRLYTLLMAVDWTAGHVAVEKSRGKLRAMKITAMEGEDVPDAPEEAVRKIFDLQPPRQRDSTQTRFVSLYVGKREEMDPIVRMAYAYARKHDHDLFIRTALRLVCRKSTDNAHDIKFPAAIFENYALASREWRPHLLAASIHWLHGTQMDDTPAVKQAIEILKS